MRHRRKFLGHPLHALSSSVNPVRALGDYGLLTLVGMDWNPATRVTAFHWQWPEPADLILLLLWAAVFLIVGRTLFVRKEV